jgi:putative sterol carrier protein
VAPTVVLAGLRRPHAAARSRLHTPARPTEDWARRELHGRRSPRSTVIAVPDFGFDPQRIVDQIRNLAADAPAHLADGFGRLLRDASPKRVEQVMRSPVRKPILDGIFWQMPNQLDVKQAAGLRSSIRFCITGRADGGVDTYQLEVEDGRAWTIHGTGGPDPRLTITVDAVEFLRLASGNSDPMQSYFKGHLQLAGDIMVAAKLAQLFKMPGSGNGGARA